MRENDLSFEIQICLQSMDILNDLTHQILKKERSLKKENRDDRERIGNLESRLIDEKSSTKLYNAFNRENENVTRRINGREVNIKELEKLREFIHFVSGEISGANTMMDSNIYAEKASEITKIGFIIFWFPEPTFISHAIGAPMILAGKYLERVYNGATISDIGHETKNMVTSIKDFKEATF